jgi:hypothetical protein
MESVHQEVGPHPTVRIATVDGDLRVSGRGGTRLEAQAGSRGGLVVQARGEVVEITSRTGCLVFLPQASRLEIGRVTGDVRLADMAGAISLEQVGGDLTLRRVGPTKVGDVAGELVVRRMTDALSVRSAGGDGRLEHVRGPVDIGRLDGDLRATQIEAALTIRLSGDAWLEWLPPVGTDSLVESTGDLLCRFLAAASVAISARAGGDLQLLGETGSGEHRRTLGDGAATVALVAGGDLLVTQAGAEFTADLAEEISAQVDATLADVEAGLEGLDLSSLGLESKDVRDKVHHALTHALRRARRGPRTSDEEPTESPPAGDQERLTILRMLEEGKLNVEQAESLLRALEEGA